jgi:hypothetical protein
MPLGDLPCDLAACSAFSPTDSRLRSHLRAQTGPTTPARVRFVRDSARIECRLELHAFRLVGRLYPCGMS